MIKKIRKLAAYFGIFGSSVSIHGFKFSNVKKSTALKEFYLNKNFEIEMFKLIEGFGYQSFLDLGSYFGYFAIFAKAKANIRNVIAYEADPENFTMLENYVKDNNVKIKTFNLAVGDSQGEVDLYRPVYKGTAKYPTHNQIGDPNLEPGNLYAGKKYKKVSVHMQPILSILKEHVQGMTLVKIDIEGYEERCLISIDEYLSQVKQVDFLVEIMINDHNKEEIFNILNKNGFNSYLLTNAGLVLENRPLTLPKPYNHISNSKLRTLWKNHLFTKRSVEDVRDLNKKIFGYDI